MINGKRILIFGGSGSLGNALVDRYLQLNMIGIYSRDECKHWEMELKYKKNPNLSFIIGDIRDKEKVRDAVDKFKPDIVIIAAAMKHIDRCEYESHECIMTNVMGIKNVLDVIDASKKVEAVCFISTDKACSPVNTYGMCKAVSEAMVVEKAKLNKDTKWVVVRYGNVLNSRGSIIPLLQSIGENPNVNLFTLTDEKMTRFIMTLDESVSLIEHAILESESGDISIPKLKAMRIVDIMNIFSGKYNKQVVKTCLRPGEKLAESLINETQSYRVVKASNEKYMYIKPCFKTPQVAKDFEPYDYNSSQDVVTCDELRSILTEYHFM